MRLFCFLFLHYYSQHWTFDTNFNNFNNSLNLLLRQKSRYNIDIELITTIIVIILFQIQETYSSPLNGSHRGTGISTKKSPLPFLKSSESSLDVHVHTVAALTNLSREAYRFENLLPTVLLSRVSPPSRASIQRMPTIRSIRYNQMTISDNLRLRASRDFSLERRLSRTILRFVSPIPRSSLLCPHCATMVTSLRITRWRERERERGEKIEV